MSIFPYESSRGITRHSNLYLHRKAQAYSKDEYPKDYGDVPIYVQKRRGSIDTIKNNSKGPAYLALDIPKAPLFSTWIYTETARKLLLDKGPFYGACRFKDKEYPGFYPELKIYYEEIQNKIKNKNKKAPSSLIFISGKFKLNK